METMNDRQLYESLKRAFYNGVEDARYNLDYNEEIDVYLLAVKHDLSALDVFLNPTEAQYDDFCREHPKEDWRIVDSCSEEYIVDFWLTLGLDVR